MRIRLSVLLCAALLTLTSCMIAGDEDAGLTDALKISAFVYPSAEQGGTYALEELALHEPRRLARGNVTGLKNYNMYFTFKGGLIEVEAENKDMQLSTGPHYELWKNTTDDLKRTYGVHARLPDEGYVSVNPLGLPIGDRGYAVVGDNDMAADAYTGETYSFDGHDAYIGKEYELTAKAYTLENPDAPLITAKVRLVWSEETVSDESGEPRKSYYFTIELTEYEYSDMYKLMESG